MLICKVFPPFSAWIPRESFSADKIRAHFMCYSFTDKSYMPTTVACSEKGSMEGIMEGNTINRKGFD